MNTSTSDFILFDNQIINKSVIKQIVLVIEDKTIYLVFKNNDKKEITAKNIEFEEFEFAQDALKRYEELQNQLL